MSMGPMGGLGGGLTLGDISDCICQYVNPILYPPDPCCSGDGNGGGGGGSCGTDGNGGGILYPQGSGGGTGNGNGNCSCSGNGNGNGGNGGSNGNNGNGDYILCLEDATYGGGRDSLIGLSGNVRNGAKILGLGSPAPCQSPVGTQPVPVPTGPYSATLIASPASSFPLATVMITCVETGVTQTTGSCANGGTSVFAFSDTSTYHFTAPGGTYTRCDGGGQGTYASGSGQGQPSLVHPTILVNMV